MKEFSAYRPQQDIIMERILKDYGANSKSLTSKQAAVLAAVLPDPKFRSAMNP